MKLPDELIPIERFRDSWTPKEATEVVVRLALSVAHPLMRMVELGTYAGWTAIALGQIAKELGGVLYSVDWFRGSPSATGACNYENYNGAHIIGSCFANVRDAGLLDSWALLVMRSQDAASLFPDGSLDLVFIAADHRYYAVRRDIAHWLPKLRAEGIICGHQFEERIPSDSASYEHMMKMLDQDYEHGHHWGLIAAVQESFGKFDVEEQIWWAEKEWAA